MVFETEHPVVAAVGEDCRYLPFWDGTVVAKAGTTWKGSWLIGFL
jgi:hypothetical protein